MNKENYKSCRNQFISEISNLLKPHEFLLVSDKHIKEKNWYSWRRLRGSASEEVRIGYPTFNAVPMQSIVEVDFSRFAQKDRNDVESILDFAAVAELVKKTRTTYDVSRTIIGSRHKKITSTHRMINLDIATELRWFDGSDNKRGLDETTFT